MQMVFKKYATLIVQPKINFISLAYAPFNVVFKINYAIYQAISNRIMDMVFNVSTIFMNYCFKNDDSIVIGIGHVLELK